MDEIWVDIKDYEGLYQVSNYGRVKSLGNNKSKKDKILKPYKNTNGYYSISLYKNKISKNKRINRLVAQAFLPNPSNLPFVNHKDENPLNNRVNNLEWCTHKYNMNYGTRNKRISTKMTGNTNQKNKEKQVLQYTLDGHFIKEYPSAKEAERQTGIWQTNICQCCKNSDGFKSAGGYVWKYKDV